MADDTEDVFDYPMSDHFVSQTRRSPYRTGFQPRRFSRKPSIHEALQFSDRVFSQYVRNGCQLPNAEPDVQSELPAQQEEIRDLKIQMQADPGAQQDAIRALQHQVGQLMQRLNVKTPPGNLSERKGLDVTPRS